MSNDYVITPPAPPRPPAPHRKSRILLLSLIGLCSLVLVAAVLTGVWLLRPSGDKAGTDRTGTASTTPTTSWSLADKSYGLAGGGTDVQGLWFQGQTVIKALPEGLVGLDRATGRQQWGISTPGSGTAMCQTSPDTSDNVLVLAYGQDRTCDHFYAVDLSRRKVLWEHTLEHSDWVAGKGVRIARTGDVVVLEADQRIAEAFRVSDGKSLWKDGNSVYQPKDSHDDCTGRGYTGGKTLIRLERCSTGRADGDPYYVAAVDPATGHSRWKHRVDGKDGELTEVLATSPVIYSMPDKDRPLDGLLRMHVLDDAGRPRSSLAPGPEHRTFRHVDNGSQLPDIRIVGDVLAAITTMDSKDRESGKDHNKIVAWSLTSGKRLWEHTSTGYIQQYLPVDSPDTPGIYAYSSGNIYDPSTLFRFDPVTGRQSIIRRYPPTPDERTPSTPFVTLAHDTLYLSARFEEALPGIEKDKRDKALIVKPVK
ncbi:PQQ-binding-like beta-propeller repeat protein [Streptomyces caatingaensis]|uniref:Pyrrolo-quinoline quinone repeat domain-containing protein n=1 Tax=Streptomyces caatingaensis TaxID=1678637 RepID=A0A0K9X8B4_9ACTN|nr:PQQ-binding-like beta-propeller repeat protein [Streptomyces caatingaensis]KNB49341.1 hypothetical protein AC230_29160 [Streptomyces caatingaensis]